MRDFSKIYKEDLDVVGKKAVEIAELTRLGIPIPVGFVISISFFKKFLDQTGISEKIKEVQKLNHPAISESIEKLSDPIKKQIMQTYIPENLTSELYKFYKKLAGLFKDQSFNIFSSSPSNNKSVIFKNVKGDANLILKIKEIWATHIDKPVAIIVQRNINSEKIGRITTDDPRLSASLVGELGSASVPTKELENIAGKIQKHFYFPKDIDYVIEKGKVYITAIQPFTGEVEKTQRAILQNKKSQNVLVKGISINPGIVTGPVKILSKNNRLQIKNGEIIILPQLNRSLFGKIKKAKAMVTDAISLNPYDRMLYRKRIKIPTIIGAINATKILHNGNIITVNGTTGEIYAGGLI